ncbi:unnamed protein product [Kuraishia capsulata CBS 1993]|uniref:Uncharacterized protein n=1 Tax=Kuraishia capsulata CBS 1993 TaxID=1382522 RepID=W6MGH2_9ASCO|nr:uncharacterized protein KUCA_T00000868001 [Kuraishia capsulata CBS 1993]CDK24901.1 unnamed protein product [Kuraishia capsulata CBS 1993]
MKRRNPRQPRNIGVKKSSPWSAFQFKNTRFVYSFGCCVSVLAIKTLGGLTYIHHNSLALRLFEVFLFLSAPFVCLLVFTNHFLIKEKFFVENKRSVEKPTVFFLHEELKTRRGSF